MFAYLLNVGSFGDGFDWYSELSRGTYEVSKILMDN